MAIIMEGIDVSKYQGDVDWKKVKAAGKSFAMIRQGWINYNGTITVDPYYTKNMKNAQAAGVHTGVYLYSYATSNSAMVAAAKQCVELLKGFTCDMPVALDFEDVSTYKKFLKETNNAMVNAFMKQIEALGFYAILYTYKNFAATYLDMTCLKSYDFWLAHYTSKTDYSGSYGMWQFSSTQNVDGIIGNVDCNHAYKDYPSIIKKAGLNGLVQEKKRDITILQASSGDINNIAALAESLGLKYNIV